MLEKCVGCFKPVTNPEICVNCGYTTAHNIVSEISNHLGESLPPGLLEEIKYDVFCKIGIKGGERKTMGDSILAKIIGRCGPTAIYLGKKRFANMDDLKVIYFSLLNNAAYITNGDVVIRISQLPDDALDGLRNDLPVYDYISERFIPNPLPYEEHEMDKVFDDDYAFAITLPVHHILDRIYNVYPEALKRRSMFAVFDTGYSFYNGSIVIPRFEVTPDRKSFCRLPNGRTIIVSSDSKLSSSILEPNTAYVGHPIKVIDDVIVVNVYKKFERTVSIGLFDTSIPGFDDDIHPFDLDLYATKDLIRFPLDSCFTKSLETSNEREKTMYLFNTFKYFYPTVIEAEHLYETLLLFAAFGYEYVNFCSKDPNLPILLEGVRTLEEQPLVEAVIGIVAVGRDGRECEEVLASTINTR